MLRQKNIYLKFVRQIKDGFEKCVITHDGWNVIRQNFQSSAVSNFVHLKNYEIKCW